MVLCSCAAAQLLPLAAATVSPVAAAPAPACNATFVPEAMTNEMNLACAPTPHTSPDCPSLHDLACS